MTTTLGFSIVEDQKKENTKIEKIKNKTIRKRDNKVKNFLKSMKKTLSNKKDDSDDEEDIGSEYIPSTQPITEPQTSENSQHAQDNSEEQEMLQKGLEQQRSYLEQNTSNNLPYLNKYIQNYTGTPNYVPNYNETPKHTELNNNELMKKLNYVVHMLEEQHDEKTGSITEELILYTFLGIFVIFVVDSFAKTGKYKR
jgi:hypothetical protein